MYEAIIFKILIEFLCPKSHSFEHSHNLLLPFSTILTNFIYFVNNDIYYVESFVEPKKAFLSI